MYDYNSTRNPLVLKEYGRNVQKLVEGLGAIEDKATRTLHAQGILKLMAILSVNNRHSIENTQKRWDDLFIMSDYTLDVNSPHKMPEKGALTKNIQRLEYNKQPIKFRNYGRNIERLIQKAVALEHSDEQEKMVIGIAKLMKSFSNEWNKDNIDYDTIMAHIKHMAGSKLMVDFEKIKAQNTLSMPYKDRNKGSRASKGSGKRQ